MIHAREDYNRMQDPALRDPSLLAAGSTPIGEFEPVVLFRAQDRHFVPVLMAYRDMVTADPGIDKNLGQRERLQQSIDAQVKRAETWQRQHPQRVKSPDLPAMVIKAPFDHKPGPSVQDALNAVLLFHNSGNWNDAARERWYQLTGQREATTRILCDTVQRALAEAERPQ